MKTTEKFNGLASVYAAGRPAYADEFLAELYEKFGFSTNSIIADIGSGGGIQKDDMRIRSFFDNKYERIEYDNPLRYDKVTFCEGIFIMKKGYE